MVNLGKTTPFTTPGHVATIEDDFLSDRLHVECSCGWVSDNVTIETAAASYNSSHVGQRAAGRAEARRQQRLLAMADHAAHAAFPAVSP